MRVRINLSLSEAEYKQVEALTRAGRYKTAYDVEPGNTYFFWVSGSKIMLCGLAFDTNGDVNGISNVVAPEADANAPIYNLAGQRVSSDFKGIAIQNGKKFVK